MEGQLCVPVSLNSPPKVTPGAAPPLKSEVPHMGGKDPPAGAPCNPRSQLLPCAPQIRDPHQLTPFPACWRPRPGPLDAGAAPPPTGLLLGGGGQDHRMQRPPSFGRVGETSARGQAVSGGLFILSCPEITSLCGSSAASPTGAGGATSSPSRHPTGAGPPSRQLLPGLLAPMSPPLFLDSEEEQAAAEEGAAVPRGLWSMVALPFGPPPPRSLQPSPPSTP